MEEESVDERAEEAEADEADDRPDHSQEVDHAEVLEKQRFPEGVARGEDDGRQYDGEKDLIVEHDLAVQALRESIFT